MSLLNAFLRDGWQQPVVKSDVFFAYRTDTALGSGTRDDPYNGNDDKAPGNFDSKLDAVPANTTIRLGPGTFKTKGTAGWTPKSGQRIIGAGLAETILQVSGVPSGNAVAIGNVGNPPYLDGFEASDLTIDCNLGGNANATGVGGIAVNGKHVYLCRLRVHNFGVKDSTNICRAISAALSGDGAEAEDCVIDACRVDSPASSSHSSGRVTCLHLGRAAAAGAAFHQSCVIRNCFVDCGSTSKPFRGIEASGGSGTLVESNQILNCQYGGPYQDTTSSISTRDLVVRGNYYSNVRYGIYLSVPASITPIERVVLLENAIELETAGTPEGIRIDGANTLGRFQVLVVRGNLIRHIDGASGPSGTLGIRLNACTDAILENNVVNVATADNAVRHDYCTNVKVFNNQKSDGEFLPGYEAQTGQHDWELTTDTELAFLVR